MTSQLSIRSGMQQVFCMCRARIVMIINISLCADSKEILTRSTLVTPAYNLMRTSTITVLAMWLCHGEQYIYLSRWCFRSAFASAHYGKNKSFDYSRNEAKRGGEGSAKQTRIAERWDNDFDGSSVLSNVNRDSQTPHTHSNVRSTKSIIIYLLFRIEIETLPNANRFRPRAHGVLVGTHACAPTSSATIIPRVIVPVRRRTKREKIIESNQQRREWYWFRCHVTIHLAHLGKSTT